MTQWIVTPWDHTDSSVNDAFIVEADHIEEAARIGLEWLQEAWDEKDAGEQIENVYVAPWDCRVAFTRRLGVERSEMQCCGGPSPYVEDGHYATCPNHVKKSEEEAS